MSDKFFLIAESEYLKLVKNFGKPSQSSPAPIEIEPQPEEPETIAVPEVSEEEAILQLIPKRLRLVSQQVLHTLKQRAKDQLSWDSVTGLVSIKGKTVDGLLISDLLHALASPLQKTPLPGLDSIVSILKEIHFPRLLIKNLKIRAALTESPPIAAATSTIDKVDIAPTPAKRPWKKWK